jgi:hypothetical protein
VQQLEVPDWLVERITVIRDARPDGITLPWDLVALELLEFGCAVAEEIDASMEGTRDMAVRLVATPEPAAGYTLLLDGVEYASDVMEQHPDGTIVVRLVDADQLVKLRIRPDGLFDVVERLSCTDV